MRKSPDRNKQVSKDQAKTVWKRRPSEIRGYQAALYLNAENGDYLRVDYNLKDKRVRIYLEDSEEGGNPYYLVVQNGKVTAQRNATTGRAYAVSDKLMSRSALLLTISNRQVFEMVNTGLGLEAVEKLSREKQIKREERKEMLDQTRKRYFRPESASAGDDAEAGITTSRRFLIDLLDIVMGMLVCGGLFLYHHDYVVLGISAAVTGVVLGLMDMLFRGRQPSIVKMLLFVICGLGVYIYGFYFF